MAGHDDKSLHIIHCDLDAFFAAVEQRDDPSLLGKPVIVGGIGPRGVVSTCSYEARRFGVHSAMPVAEARRLCPEGVYLQGRMGRYREISVQVFNILSQFTPLMEPLSIDEAFLDVKGSGRLFGSAEQIGRLIKTRVRDELGLNISVGISYNKYLAKLASDLGKPDGLFVIPFGQAAEILKPLPVTRIWGVGEKTRQVLHRLGIKTIGDIQKLPPEWLEKRLGKSGRHYWELAQGLDSRQVELEQERKSLGREVTFTEDQADVEILHNLLAKFSAELCYKLRQAGLVCSTVTVKIRYKSFKTINRSQTIPPSDSDLVISKVAREILRRAYQGDPPLRLLGLSLSNLSEAQDLRQADLFESFDQNRAINQLMDNLHQRFGPGTIRPASLIEPKE